MRVLTNVSAVWAVWVGKVTLSVLRLLGRRGNALPGLVVEKVFPRYLTRAMAALPEGVVGRHRHEREDHHDQDGGDDPRREIPRADQ